MLGTDYDIGKNYRGIWGLYGNYSYMAPQIFRFRYRGFRSERPGVAVFRFSGTAGTGLLGVGYASVSDIHGISDESANHYGVAPQALLALRLIVGDRASLDLIAREYFVSDLSGSRARHDNVVRADAFAHVAHSSPACGFAQISVVAT